MECHACHQPFTDEEPTRTCPHIAEGVHEGNSRGFHFDAASTRERPEAWCSGCEVERQQSGSAGHDTLEGALRHPLCVDCYDDARRSNGPWGTTFVMNPEMLLADCVQSVGTGPRRFPFWRHWGYLRPRKPRWAYTDDDIRPFYTRYQEALRQGHITWGALVQADAPLFQPGAENLAGEVVFVPDATTHVDLIELKRVAERLRALKEAPPSDASFGAFSAYLEDRLPRAFGLPVPERLSPKLPCALSTVMFNRAHLPNRRLSRQVFPVMVTPGPRQVAVVLPSHFWPARFCTFWVEGDGQHASR